MKFEYINIYTKYTIVDLPSKSSQDTSVLILVIIGLTGTPLRAKFAKVNVTMLPILTSGTSTLSDGTVTQLPFGLQDQLTIENQEQKEKGRGKKKEERRR